MAPYSKAIYRKAFSFSEVLVAVLIVAFALVPILGLLSGNTRQVAFNQDSSVAQLLATQVLERYRYEDYGYLLEKFSSLEAGKSVIESDELLSSITEDLPPAAESLYGKFERYAVFKETVPGLRGVFEVVVKWKNMSGRDNSLKLRAVLYNREFHAGEKSSP